MRMLLFYLTRSALNFLSRKRSPLERPASRVPLDLQGLQHRPHKWPQRRPQYRRQQWPLGLPVKCSRRLEAHPGSRGHNSLPTAGLSSARSIWTSLSRTSRQLSIVSPTSRPTPEAGVVDSSRYSLHRGGISIRVPAELIESTIDELRRVARKVQVEQTTSRDVTDEYVDLGARLRNEQVAEEALLTLLERADSVEAALNVRRDLRTVQGEIERISGRIKFLEETSAFSLIRVTLGLRASRDGSRRRPRSDGGRPHSRQVQRPPSHGRTASRTTKLPGTSGTAPTRSPSTGLRRLRTRIS